MCHQNIQTKQGNTVADTAKIDKSTSRQFYSAGRQLLRSVALATDNFQPVKDVCNRDFILLYTSHMLFHK